MTGIWKNAGISLIARAVACSLLGVACSGCNGSGASVGASVSGQAGSPPARLTPDALSKLDEYGKKIVQLGGRPELHLDLSFTAISDSDLASLEVMPIVTSIDLSHTKITDVGIAHLKNYPQLEKLTLSGVPLTDASLNHIKQMPKIYYVYFTNSNVSREAQMDFIAFLSHRAQAEMKDQRKRKSGGAGGPQ